VVLRATPGLRHAKSAEAVARLLGNREPLLMVTDPPYGIELDSEGRDGAGLNAAPGGLVRSLRVGAEPPSRLRLASIAIYTLGSR
jgi:hypothetical protein